ncbi:MAG: hypothetical protein Q9222_006400 [Ikaeria aurantiellina]
MATPPDAPLPSYEIHIVPSSDPIVLPTFLYLFDEAVEWLTARGLSSQWGTEPMKSDPTHIEKVQRMVDICTVFLASPKVSPSSESISSPVDEPMTPSLVPGMCLISRQRCHPEIIPPASEPENYIQYLATSRSHAASKGLGKAFIEVAEKFTRDQGLGLLRLDCFAGGELGEGGLVKVYERLGFRKAGPKLVYDESGWLGQVMEKKVGKAVE